jgi:protein-L-isoaspartate(D-aspartate) O-methyltransferase
MTNVMNFASNLHEPTRDDWAEKRRQMVEIQIRDRGVRDELVLRALLNVPREPFVPSEFRSQAYDDRAVPIGHGQTISQPFIVAYMTEQLRIDPDCTVLEVGTGSGFQTAILTLLAKQVYSVERIEELSRRAQEALRTMNRTNVTIRISDGSLGWPEHAPFDRILVTAASPQVPEALVDQLVDGGLMVLPVGPTDEQVIVRIVRKGRRTIETPLLPCRFVKLIGKEGWPIG